MSSTAEAAPVRAAHAVPDATADGGPGFRSTGPVRVLDTRSGLGAPAGPVGAGRSIDVQLTGTGGVPATGVAAVVFNLTAVAPTAGGFLTVYPTGTTRPIASNLNFTTHQTIANEVVATVGTGGKATIYNAVGNTHVLADVTGWFATGSYYTGLTPSRLLDTRTGLGTTVAAPVGPRQHVDIQVAGRGGVPATGAVAVAVTLTGTHPTSGTFVTAYPTGENRPNVSNLNLGAGQTAAVMAVEKLGTGGQVSLYNDVGTVHLVADVTGWFAPNGQFTPISPTRIADTRANHSPLGPGESRGFGVDPSVAPKDAVAVVLSVTAVAPTALGFLTVDPIEPSKPNVSMVSFAAGHTTANLVITHKVSDIIDIFNSSGSTHVVIDVLGWFGAPLFFTNPLVVRKPFVSAPYAEPLAATGGVAPYTWTVSAGSLPEGLALSSGGSPTATISGTPTTPGRSPFTIRVSDASGMFDEWPFTLEVTTPPPGAVWAWGRGTGGRLGNGSTDGAGQPLPVVDLTGVNTVAANGSGAYALRSDGTVWAWGQGPAGQLGNGTTTDSSTPVRVGDLTGITAITAGYGSGYALAADGTVWAWGGNFAGELGDGSTVNRDTPVRVSGLTGITAIAAGAVAGYALASDGTVWAWGDNRLAELGNGTTTSSSTPVRVSGLTGITAIASQAASAAGYALASDGTVWAWGDNGLGELGNGTTTSSSTPVRVSGLTGVTAIGAGSAVGFATTADGTAWAWGSNDSGQLGDGTLVDRTTPVRVSGLTGVTAIEGTFDYAMALRSDGTVWMWGDTSRAISQPSSPTPVRMGGLPPSIDVSPGESASYAVGAP